MGLMQTMRWMWEADSSLNGLIDVTRLTTGRTSGSELPYAVCLPRDVVSLARTNTADRFDKTDIEFKVFSDQLSVLESVVDNAVRVYSSEQKDSSLDVRYRFDCTAYSFGQSSGGEWYAALKVVVKTYPSENN